MSTLDHALEGIACKKQKEMEQHAADLAAAWLVYARGIHGDKVSKSELFDALCKLRINDAQLADDRAGIARVAELTRELADTPKKPLEELRAEAKEAARRLEAARKAVSQAAAFQHRSWMWLQEIQRIKSTRPELWSNLDSLQNIGEPNDTPRKTESV